MPDLPTRPTGTRGYGLQAFGQGLQQLGQGLFEAQQTLVAAAAQTQYSDARARSIEAMTQFRIDLLNDPDYESYNQKWEDFKNNLAGQMEPVLRLRKAKEAFTTWFTEASSEQAAAIAGQARERLVQHSKAIRERNLQMYADAGEWELIQKELDEDLAIGMITGEEAAQYENTYLPEAKFDAAMTFLQYQPDPIQLLQQPGAADRFGLTEKQLDSAISSFKLRQSAIDDEAARLLEEQQKQAKRAFYLNFTDKAKLQDPQFYDKQSKLMYSMDVDDVPQALNELQAWRDGQGTTEDTPYVESKFYNIWKNLSWSKEQRQTELEKYLAGVTDAQGVFHKAKGDTVYKWVQRVQDESPSKDAADIFDAIERHFAGLRSLPNRTAKEREQDAIREYFTQVGMDEYMRETATDPQRVQKWRDKLVTFLADEQYGVIAQRAREVLGAVRYPVQLRPEVGRARELATGVETGVLTPAAFPREYAEYRAGYERGEVRTQELAALRTAGIKAENIIGEMRNPRGDIEYHDEEGNRYVVREAAIPRRGGAGKKVVRERVYRAIYIPTKKDPKTGETLEYRIEYVLKAGQAETEE